MQAKLLRRGAMIANALLCTTLAHADVGETFGNPLTGLSYYVLTEDTETKTGTVAVGKYDDDHKPTGVLDLTNPVSRSNGINYTITNIAWTSPGLSSFNGGFSDCDELTKIILPAGLESFRAGYTSGCNKLMNYEIDESNTKMKTVDGVLYSKDGTELIGLPAGRTSYVMPDDVTRIWASAIYSPNLLSVKLSSNLQEILRYNFQCDNLDFGDLLDLPKSISILKDGCFNGCKVKKIIVHNKVTYLENSVFSGLPETEEIEIRGNVTGLWAKNFYYCPKLKTVTFTGITAVPTIQFTDDIFGGTTVPANVTVYVPEALVDAFKADEKWGAFGVNFATYVPTTYPAAVTAAGAATWVAPEDVDFTSTPEIKAYYVSVTRDFGAGKIKLTPTTTAKKGEAVLLMADGAVDVEVAPAEGEVPGAEVNDIGYSTNELVAVTTDTFLPTIDGSYRNYILNDGAEGLGFYQANDQLVAAGKAYLSVHNFYVPTDASAKFLPFDFGGEATGIRTAETQASGEQTVYNLAGQRVAKPQKGLYIVNGKKVVVR